PAVVREASVEDGGIVAEADLESGRLRGGLPRRRRRRRRLPLRRGRDGLRRERGVRHDAVVQPPPPLRLELWRERRRRLLRALRRGGLVQCLRRAIVRLRGSAARLKGSRYILLTPEFADDVVRGSFRAIAQRREDFVRRAAAVERSDERLHDRNGALVRARVAPRFEKVGFRNVPVTQGRRLIVVLREMD